MIVADGAGGRRAGRVGAVPEPDAVAGDPRPLGHPRRSGREPVGTYPRHRHRVLVARQDGDAPSPSPSSQAVPDPGRAVPRSRHHEGRTRAGRLEPRERSDRAGVAGELGHPPVPRVEDAEDPVAASGHVSAVPASLGGKGKHRPYDVRVARAVPPGLEGGEDGRREVRGKDVGRHYATPRSGRQDQRSVRGAGGGGRPQAGQGPDRLPVRDEGAGEGELTRRGGDGGGGVVVLLHGARFHPRQVRSGPI